MIHRQVPGKVLVIGVGVGEAAALDDQYLSHLPKNTVHYHNSHRTNVNFYALNFLKYVINNLTQISLSWLTIPHFYFEVFFLVVSAAMRVSGSSILKSTRCWTSLSTGNCGLMHWRLGGRCIGIFPGHSIWSWIVMMVKALIKFEVLHVFSEGETFSHRDKRCMIVWDGTQPSQVVHDMKLSEGATAS